MSSIDDSHLHPFARIAPTYSSFRRNDDSQPIGIAPAFTLVAQVTSATTSLRHGKTTCSGATIPATRKPPALAEWSETTGRSLPESRRRGPVRRRASSAGAATGWPPPACRRRAGAGRAAGRARSPGTRCPAARARARRAARGRRRASVGHHQHPLAIETAGVDRDRLQHDQRLDVVPRVHDQPACDRTSHGVVRRSLQRVFLRWR